MPFNRPELTELIQRVEGDIDSRLPGADAGLRRRVLSALARAVAAAAHGLHGHLDWLSGQVLPDTAEAEMLERHAGIWGVRRKPAAFSAGTVAITGVAGAVLPAGTVMQRADGVEFAVAADVELAGSAGEAAVTAVEAGVGGNTDSGTGLTLVSPVDGIDSTATVGVAGLTGGVDAEADASLRARLLARIQQPPHGGAEADYKSWALEVSGVTRAWVYPRELGDGTVTVRIVADDADGGPVPDSTLIDAVQQYMDTVRPVAAEVFVVAPVAVPLDLTIELAPNTAAVRAAVEAELTDMMRRDAVPGGTIHVSRIREAISIAPGEVSHDLLAPETDVTHQAGEMAVLGEIIWI